MVEIKREDLQPIAEEVVKKVPRRMVKNCAHFVVWAEMVLDMQLTLTNVDCW